MFPTMFRAAQRLPRVDETWLIGETSCVERGEPQANGAILQVGSGEVLARRQAPGRWLGDAAIQGMLRDAMLRPLDGSKPRRPTTVLVHDEELLAVLERPLLLIGVKMEVVEDADDDPDDCDEALPESCELTLSEALPRWMRRRVADVVPELAPRLALAESDSEDGLPGWAVVWVDEAEAAATVEALTGADRYASVLHSDLEDDGGDLDGGDDDERGPLGQSDSWSESRHQFEPTAELMFLVAAGAADPIAVDLTTAAALEAMPRANDGTVPLVLVVAVRHAAKPVPAFARIAHAAWLQAAQECGHCLGLHLPDEEFDDDLDSDNA